MPGLFIVRDSLIEMAFPYLFLRLVHLLLRFGDLLLRLRITDMAGLLNGKGCQSFVSGEKVVDRGRNDSLILLLFFLLLLTLLIEELHEFLCRFPLLVEDLYTLLGEDLVCLPILLFQAFLDVFDDLLELMPGFFITGFKEDIQGFLFELLWRYGPRIRCASYRGAKVIVTRH